MDIYDFIFFMRAVPWDESDEEDDADDDDDVAWFERQRQLDQERDRQRQLDRECNPQAWLLRPQNAIGFRRFWFRQQGNLVMDLWDDIEHDGWILGILFTLLMGLYSWFSFQ